VSSADRATYAARGRHDERGILVAARIGTGTIEFRDD
jgi:hypothetical protein